MGASIERWSEESFRHNHNSGPHDGSELCMRWPEMNLITIEVFDDRYDFGFAVSAGGWCCNCWCCSCSSPGIATEEPNS